jgi:branched-chain amino acid transport system permease protein
MKLKQSDLWMGLAILAAFFVLAWLPVVPGADGWLSIVVPITMYTVLATSWAIFSGPTHYVSLATAAFFGVGSYTLALGLESLPYPVLLIIAAILGAVMAALVGWATLRLSGVYFVIFTLGLAELIRQVFTWYQNNMGGTRGSYVFTDLTDAHIYWQLLALALLVYLVGWLINRSRLGFAIRVIGGDESVAKHSGINVAWSKIVLFMVSGSVAAVVGAILAPRFVYIEPSMAFNPQLSFMVVIMALLGGTQRLWGPLMGAIPFAFVWEIIAANFPAQTTLLMGVAFLLVVFYIPNGISGVMIRWYQKARSRPGVTHE